MARLMRWTTSVALALLALIAVFPSPSGASASRARPSASLAARHLTGHEIERDSKAAMRIVQRAARADESERPATSGRPGLRATKYVTRPLAWRRSIARAVEIAPRAPSVQSARVVASWSREDARSAWQAWSLLDFVAVSRSLRRAASAQIARWRRLAEVPVARHRLTRSAFSHDATAAIDLVTKAVALISSTDPAVITHRGKYRRLMTEAAALAPVAATRPSEPPAAGTPTTWTRADARVDWRVDSRYGYARFVWSAIRQYSLSRALDRRAAAQIRAWTQVGALYAAVIRSVRRCQVARGAERVELHCPSA